MLLAIDTSTAQMGLALFDGAQVAAESMWTSRQHHTVELAPAVAELLRRCGMDASSLEAIGVAIGPGSFTSLRVGLAFAKGLALARRLALIGVPTLDVVAAAQPIADVPLVAVLQAGRGRLSVGRYERSGSGWRSVGAARVETTESLARSIRQPSIVCGELSAEDRQRLRRKRVNVLLSPPSSSVRRPAILAELAWERWRSGPAQDAAALAPIYLHSAEPVPG